MIVKPLLPRPEVTDHSTLTDLFLCMAVNIEDSLLEAGAIPDKDYTRLDLYKLAQPFAVDVFVRTNVSFDVRWNGELK